VSITQGRAKFSCRKLRYVEQRPASGNTLYDGNNEYWYDAEGQLCAVQSLRYGAGTVYQYVYDPEGARIAKGTMSTPPAAFTKISAGLGSSPTCAPPLGSNFSATARYLVDLGGQQVTELNGAGKWQHSNVWAGGKLVATYDLKGIHFELTDPLGTKRVQANSQGQADEWCTSLPFGNDLNNPPNLANTSCTLASNTTDTLQTQSDATEHHFTQKERDTDTGNDYFFARYYTSALGRFTTPDWSAKTNPVPYAVFTDPQSLNLYAYVRNNPITRMDLDGHACNGNDWGCNSWSANSAQSEAVRKAQQGTAQQNLDPTADAAKSGAQRTGAVTSTNVGGVWVNAYGGTAGQRSAELAAFSQDVTQTDRGKAMLSALQHRKSGLFGLWGGPKPFDLIQVASRGSYSYAGGQSIMLDYHDVGAGYPSASGGGTYSLQRIFAHELGHAAMGNLDNGPGQMNNVNWNENPVMRQLGDFNDRTAYAY
jgi:RHS repeat-associated protein